MFGCGCDFSKWLIVGKESDSKFVKVQQLHLPLTWIILVDVLVLNFPWISCGLKSAYFDRALFRTCRESSRTCTYVCSLCTWLAGTVRNLRIGYTGTSVRIESCSCSLAVLDPRVGHTMDVLSPFMSVLCHSDWLFHRESCPRLDVIHPGRAWPSSPSCTWHCSLHYLFLQATPLFPHCVTTVC